MPLSRKHETLLRKLLTRHGRRKEHCCVCEGLRAAEELYRSAPQSVKFTVATADAAKKLSIPGEVEIVSDAELAAFASTVHSQGILAVAAIPEEPDGGTAVEDPFLLALDGLNDPGNFGTICRTARASGLHEIWYTRGSVDPFGDKALRASMGAPFAMRFRSFGSLEELTEKAAGHGFKTVYLTDPHEGENCFTAPGLFSRTVLVIGGEANGATMLEGARHTTIPMPGKFESLNAAQAATVFLFEFVRRTGLL